MAMLWTIVLIFDLILMFDLIGQNSQYYVRFIEKSITEFIQLLSFGFMITRKESKGSRGIHAIVYTVVSVVLGLWMIYEYIQSINQVCNIFDCSDDSRIAWIILGTVYEFNWFWFIVYFSVVRATPLIFRVYFCLALISYWSLKEADLMLQSQERAERQIKLAQAQLSLNVDETEEDMPIGGY